MFSNSGARKERDDVPVNNWSNSSSRSPVASAIGSDSFTQLFSR